VVAPTLETVRRHGTTVVVQGHVEATPNARFTVEIFANRQADGAEGEIFLAEAAIATDAKGLAAFSVTIPVTLHSAIPPSFTATLMSSAGATSEFSKPMELAE
jgi:hypothetical protein